MVEVHLGVLAVTAIAILYADHLGFQYFRGTKELLSRTTVSRLHYTVWVGLLAMIITGGIMAFDRWGYLSTQPVFWLKLGFVGVLVLNSLFITSLMHRASEVPFASLGSTERAMLLISGALSGISWVGAAGIGYFFL